MKIAHRGWMQTPLGHPDNGFTKALRKVCDTLIETNDITTIDSCDLLFLQPHDYGINIGQLARLKAAGAVILHWIGDARDTTPQYCYDYAPFVTVTCFSNMRDVRNMQAAGWDAAYLQIGADPEIYFPNYQTPKHIDIVFMGNNHASFPLSDYRMEMVHELKRTYGERFKSYGHGMHDGYISNQHEEAEVYRRSKIGINLSHYDYERYTSDRMMRMLCSGVCVLSHRYTAMEEEFNGEVVVWDSLDELKNQIDSLLANEVKRQEIATAGYLLALKDFTFDAMVRNIMKIYNER